MGNCDSSRNTSYGHSKCYEQQCVQKCCTSSGYCPSSYSDSCYYYYNGTGGTNSYTELANAVCQANNDYIAMVVGLSVGSIVFFFFFVVGVICYFKRKRRREEEKQA